jgi:hypothetical protein
MVVLLGAMLGAWHLPAVAQEFVIKPVVQKKIKELPAGTLYWRIENLASLAEAEAVAGPTALAAEVSGQVWLFTLGGPGGATPGATKVAEIGPIERIGASEYLLRINHASGPPGAKTSIHTHPGSEAFYVLTGQLSQRTSKGVTPVNAGTTLNGSHADMAMQVSSSGTSDLNALVMFVVDSGRPFSQPAQLAH